MKSRSAGERRSAQAGAAQGCILLHMSGLVPFSSGVLAVKGAACGFWVLVLRTDKFLPKC